MIPAGAKPYETTRSDNCETAAQPVIPRERTCLLRQPRHRARSGSCNRGSPATTGCTGIRNAGRSDPKRLRKCRPERTRTVLKKTLRLPLFPPHPKCEPVSCNGAAVYSFRSMASMASNTAPRNRRRSSSATPTIVVPPGEQTASLSCAGCKPDSSSSRPVPATICPAMR